MEQVDSLGTKHKFKKTEIGKIPVDWEILTLDNISEEIYSYPTYYDIKYVKEGIPEVSGELIKPNGALERDLSKYRFISPATASKFPRACLEEGDFVISVRGTVGKVGIVPEFLDGANMTANLIRISPKSDKVFPRFLHQLFISDKFQDILKITSSSTTIKTIKAPELKKLKFAIPPIHEQKKIAEILLTVDEAIERNAAVIEKTKQLKKGLMQELLAHGIGHKKFKKTEICEIPIDWEVVKLSSLAIANKNAFVAGPFGSNLKLKDYVKSGVPVLQGKNITSDRLDWFDIRYVSKEKAEELSRSLVKVGDILITKIRTVGCSAVVDNLKGHEVALIPANLMKISLDEKKVDINYFHQWLIWSKTKKRIIDIASQTAQPALSLKTMKLFKVLLPPLPEQKKLAEILSSIDEKIEKEIANKEKLANIKKGLMQVLLTGKIRVKV